MRIEYQDQVNEAMQVLSLYFSEQAGIRETIKKFGWDDCEISFTRGRKGPTGTQNYAIHTDFQLKLELPRILKDGDKLHGNILYLIFKGHLLLIAFILRHWLKLNSILDSYHLYHLFAIFYTNFRHYEV